MSWLKRTGNNTEKLLNDQILKTETKIEEINNAIEEKTTSIKLRLCEKNKPLAKMILIQKNNLVGQMEVLTKQLYNLEAQRSALTNSELTQQNMDAMRKAAKLANMKPDRIDAVMSNLADIMEDVEEGLDIATQSILPKQDDDEDLNLELENIIEALKDERDIFEDQPNQTFTEEHSVDELDFPNVPSFDPLNHNSDNGAAPPSMVKKVDFSPIISLF